MLLIIMKRGDSWMLPLPIVTDGTIYMVLIIIMRGEAGMLPISIVAGGTIYTWWVILLGDEMEGLCQSQSQTLILVQNSSKSPCP